LSKHVALLRFKLLMHFSSIDTVTGVW